MARLERMARQEQEILSNLVIKYKNIIECKKSDSVAVTSKAKCWQRISEEFNSHGCVTQRNPKQLRKAWDNIKMRRKSVLAEEARRRMGTGGGPYPSTSTDDTIPEVEMAIPSIGHYLHSTEDSDRLMEVPSGLEDFILLEGGSDEEEAAGSLSGPQQLQAATPIVDTVLSAAVASGSTVEPRPAVDTLLSTMGPGPSHQQSIDRTEGPRSTTAPRVMTRAEAVQREMDARLARIQSAADDEALLRQIRIQGALEALEQQRKLALEALEHQRRLQAMEIEYRRNLYSK